MIRLCPIVAPGRAGPARRRGEVDAREQPRHHGVGRVVGRLAGSAEYRNRILLVGLDLDLWLEMKARRV